MVETRSNVNKVTKKTQSKLLSTQVSKKKVGNVTQTTLKISMRDKSKISSDTVKQMLDKFDKDGRKMVLRGLNIERWMTLKTFQGDYNAEGLSNYYKNKVGEEFVENFTSFAQVQLTLFD
jgi:hypothetical protein